ncbi:hypothetical protein [Streptomyces tropicalis]|uniref:Secreted protein n=1 Tax=Streptomyces tropicalis TaxID=3034234 RepID=A0ABT6ADV6_9ACTN|nr:hypothetical protein [Streptomyces tropicalis]MDF3302824.1 hypothetical protein [Streptomyces tropicalis]
MTRARPARVHYETGFIVSYRRFLKPLALATALVGLAASPAAADSNGTFSTGSGHYVTVSGKYQVNNRAGDQRVWFIGTLNKKTRSGCDYLEAGSVDSKLVLKKKCGGAGKVKIYKKIDMGLLDDYVYYRACHTYDDYKKCGPLKHIKL